MKQNTQILEQTIDSAALQIVEQDVAGVQGCDGIPQAVMRVATGSRVITIRHEVHWDAGCHPAVNSLRLAEALGATRFVYRNSQGQLLRLKPGEKPQALSKPLAVQALLDPHVNVQVFDAKGNFKGSRIARTDLELFLATPEFLKPIPVVDVIGEHNMFADNWKMTRQGYNDFGPGQRFYQTGHDVNPRSEPRLIRRFLEIMDYDGGASATNTVGAALVRQLRHRWPGQKPFVPVTATRSHLGKDTALQFISGPGKWVDVSWEKADWAVQNQIVELLSNPDIAIVSLGNVRAAGSIASAFLERIVTTQHLDLQKSSGHSRYERPNDVLFAATANEGTFSADLLNRAWPIHLHREGDISERESPAGNPRAEFLPQHCMEIEAELLGMVLNWRDRGQPRFTAVRHPMTDCTQVIGGILEANGFKDFLANWGQTRALIDPVMEELGVMAGTHPDTPLTAMEWTQVIKRTGGVKRLIPSEFRGADERIAERLGKLLSRNQGMVAYTEDEAGIRTAYRLSKSRSRLGKGEAKVRYKFDLLAD